VSDENLKIIDTSESLTKEELQELKKLAALSKSARVFMSLVFAIVVFVGFDKLFEWFKSSHGVG
jgi:hypothetical protein